MQLDPKAFESAMKSVEGLPVNGLSYERRVITAYLSALPSPEPTEAAPAYWAAHSVSGSHIGLWPNKADAVRAVAGEQGVIFTPLYSRPAEAKAGMVKALEWRELTSPREDGPPEPIAEWEADCVIGTYIIKDDGGEWWLHLADLFDTRQVGRSDDPGRLRSIAQADYEARILSALEPVAEAKAEPVGKGDWLSRFTVENCNFAALDSAVGVLRTNLAGNGGNYQTSLWAAIVDYVERTSPTPPALTDRPVSPVAQQRAEAIEAERDKWLEAHRKTARHGYPPERKDQSNANG